MKLLCYDDLKPAKSIQYSKVQIWRLEKQGKFRSALKSDRAAAPGPSMKIRRVDHLAHC